MRLDSILRLPASVILLIASHPIHAEMDDGMHGGVGSNLMRRRVVEEQLRMGMSPVGVMKMPASEGEKFFIEYWGFGDEQERIIEKRSKIRSRDDSESLLLLNGTLAIPYRAPFALHTYESDLKARQAAVLAILENRDFVCPTGYSACSSIGYPNSCCATDENCFPIQETGLGPVGCCPKGSTCGGTITNCSAPNMPCAQDLGGGCCIPNFVCEGVGCVLRSTVIITPSTSPTTSSAVVVTTPSTVSTVSTTAPVTTTTATTTTTSSSSTSSSTIPTSTATGGPPVRPTSAPSSIPTTSSPTSDPGTACPTGFYACSAHYDGGCCQVGRDCAKKFCPTTSSTTIISSGVTVVVPVGPAATVASPTGVCATGWSTCAASVGGSCCPNGWTCGSVSCTSASPSGTGVVEKGSVSFGIRVGLDGKFIAVLGLIAGFFLV